jgi:hypothetical protein
MFAFVCIHVFNARVSFVSINAHVSFLFCAAAAAAYVSVIAGKIVAVLHGRKYLEDQLHEIINDVLTGNLKDVIKKLGVNPGVLQTSIIGQAIADPELGLKQGVQSLLQKTPLGSLSQELAMSTELVILLAQQDPAAFSLVAKQFDMEPLVVQAIFAFVAADEDMLSATVEELARLPSVGLSFAPGDSGAGIAKMLVKVVFDPAAAGSSTKRLVALLLRRMSEQPENLENLVRVLQMKLDQCGADEGQIKLALNIEEELWNSVRPAVMGESTEEARKAALRKIVTDGLLKIDASTMEPVISLANGSSNGIPKLLDLLAGFDRKHGMHIATFANLALATKSGDEASLERVLRESVCGQMFGMDTAVIEGLSMLSQLSRSSGAKKSTAEQVKSVARMLKLVLAFACKEDRGPDVISDDAIRAFSHMLLLFVALGKDGACDIPRARSLLYSLADSTVVRADGTPKPPLLLNLAGVDHLQPDMNDKICTLVKALFTLSRQPVVDIDRVANKFGIAPDLATCIAKMVDTTGSNAGSISNIAQGLEGQNPLVWLGRKMRIAPPVLVGLLEISQRRTQCAAKGNVKQAIDFFMLKLPNVGSAVGMTYTRATTEVLIDVLCATSANVQEAATQRWMLINAPAFYLGVHGVAATTDELMRGKVSRAIKQQAILAGDLLNIGKATLAAVEGQISRDRLHISCDFFDLAWALHLLVPLPELKRISKRAAMAGTLVRAPTDAVFSYFYSEFKQLRAHVLSHVYTELAKTEPDCAGALAEKLDRNRGHFQDGEEEADPGMPGAFSPGDDINPFTGMQIEVDLREGGVRTTQPGDALDSLVRRVSDALTKCLSTFFDNVRKRFDPAAAPKQLFPLDNLQTLLEFGSSLLDSDLDGDLAYASSSGLARKRVIGLLVASGPGIQHAIANCVADFASLAVYSPSLPAATKESVLLRASAVFEFQPTNYGSFLDSTLAPTSVDDGARDKMLLNYNVDVATRRNAGHFVSQVAESNGYIEQGLEAVEQMADSLGFPAFVLLALSQRHPDAVNPQHLQMQSLRWMRRMMEARTREWARGLTANRKALGRKPPDHRVLKRELRHTREAVAVLQGLSNGDATAAGLLFERLEAQHVEDKAVAEAAAAGTNTASGQAMHAALEDDGYDTTKTTRLKDAFLVLAQAFRPVDAAMEEQQHRLTLSARCELARVLTDDAFDHATYYVADTPEIVNSKVFKGHRRCLSELFDIEFTGKELRASTADTARALVSFAAGSPFGESPLSGQLGGASVWETLRNAPAEGFGIGVLPALMAARNRDPAALEASLERMYANRSLNRGQGW